MGREIKRVPLDFQWPMEKVWSGFKNPHYEACRKCPDCDGSGYSPEAERLKNEWYGNAPFTPTSPFPEDHPAIVALAGRQCKGSAYYYGSTPADVTRERQRLQKYFNGAWSHHLNGLDVEALVAADRLKDFTHTWTREGGWVRKFPPVVPTPKEVNDWSLQGGGHDSINAHVCIADKCKRLGYPLTCGVCNGAGSLWATPGDKELAEKWEKEEPPTGEGWQLWETVSEGSPISPVFDTPEALAKWLATSADYPGRQVDAGTTAEQWLAFIKGPGWAPTLMSGPDGRMMTGVQASGLL